MGACDKRTRSLQNGGGVWGAAPFEIEVRLLNLSMIKKHIRVDFDDDDDLITLEKGAAEEYVANAVGKYDDTSNLARLLVLFLVGEMYKNRQYSISVNEKNSYTVRSIVTQLQQDEYEAGDDQ